MNKKLMPLAIAGLVVFDSDLGPYGSYQQRPRWRDTPLRRGARAASHGRIPPEDPLHRHRGGVDVRLRKAENKATAASKDLQVVSTQVAVQYSLTGATMPQTYQNVGLRDEVERTAIDPGITESVKAITAQYTAEQLVTQRARVKAKIQEAIANFIDTTLEQKGVIGAVELANVAITDFEFSAEFNRAIEEKVRARTGSAQGPEREAAPRYPSRSCL